MRFEILIFQKIESHLHKSTKRIKQFDHWFATDCSDESLSLTLLCSPHVKKAVQPPTSSPYSTSVSMDSNSNSSSSSDSDSDSSTSKSDADVKNANHHPPPPPTRRNTSMEMQLHDDSGDDNYDPDNCLHTGKNSHFEKFGIPIVKILNLN